MGFLDRLAGGTPDYDGIEPGDQVVAEGRPWTVRAVVRYHTADNEWPVVQVEADGRLATYPYFHAARADLLRRLDRRAEAVGAYRAALELTSNAVERAFLARRIHELDTSRPN